MMQGVFDKGNEEQFENIVLELLIQNTRDLDRFAAVTVCDYLNFSFFCIVAIVFEPILFSFFKVHLSFHIIKLMESEAIRTTTIMSLIFASRNWYMIRIIL
jgi:hypothetical protein